MQLLFCATCFRFLKRTAKQNGLGYQKSSPNKSLMSSLALQTMCPWCWHCNTILLPPGSFLLEPCYPQRNNLDVARNTKNGPKNARYLTLRKCKKVKRSRDAWDLLSSAPDVQNKACFCVWSVFHSIQNTAWTPPFIWATFAFGTVALASLQYSSWIASETKPGYKS